MNGTIDTTAAQKRMICCIDNRINMEARNIAKNNFHSILHITPPKSV
jgi:hypothetical protein